MDKSFYHGEIECRIFRYTDSSDGCKVSLGFRVGLCTILACFALDIILCLAHGQYPTSSHLGMICEVIFACRSSHIAYCEFGK